MNKQWVRLNYATTHHHPPPSTTTQPSQNISTTTHHQPKYIHPHPGPPTICQNISTTTQHQPKDIHHYPPFPKEWTITTQKLRYIISFWHCFNSFFFFETQHWFPSRRFCVTKFRSVRFSSSKFLLTFRSSHRRCSVRIGVIRNFTIHRKTPVSQSLFW